MRFLVRLVTIILLAGLALAVTSGRARAQGEPSYRVLLYIAEGGGPAEVSITRLQEVWSPAEGQARLMELLASGNVQQLQDVTIQPGRDTPALQLGNVTVRVRGVYREPQRDAMFLRVEVDGGAEALVKELISRFDETIVLAYPLAEGNRSVVALLVPTHMGN